MNKVNNKAASTLTRLAAMAEANGGHIKIGNGEGFMPVSVEHIGSDCLSVAHYGEQNGDLMRDPDMVFWKGPDSNWYPVSFRNDYVGTFQESVHFEEGRPSQFSPRMQRQWMENIRQQQGEHLKA